MNGRLIAITLVFVLTASCIAACFSPVSAADTGFSVTDGQGTTINYGEPSNKVITVGVGLTATVIELGYIDKIVVSDNYSYTNTNEVFSEFKTLVDEGKIKAGGNIYSSGRDDLINMIVDAADDNGVFDRTRDTILITGSETYLGGPNGIVSELKGYGFERILVWNDITTYEDLVDYVESVSLVVSGKISGIVQRMKYVEDTVADTLISNGISDADKRKAFCVTYSGGTFKVGNTGSLATSMISAAGGNAFTVDSSKAVPTYEANITELVETNGTDTVVFADSALAGSAANLNSLKTLIPGISIISLGSLWNNFAPDSMDGVWAMACAMYPEYFSGGVPSVPSADGPDAVLYVIAAVVAVAAIGCVGYFVIRRG